MTEKTMTYIWLSNLLGPCSGKFRGLIERFGSAEEIYRLRNSSELLSLLSPAEQKRAKASGLSDAERIADYCDKTGTKVVCYGDGIYPEKLVDTTIPPVLLYVNGDVGVLNTVCIAGVGSRLPTQYARDAVRFLCEPLAAAGITLVSGLAAGTDTEVHKAALRVQGKTIAVLGTGIDETYPKRHTDIRGIIERNGAVVSEYPPFTRGAPYMFALRNRIISGLGKAVIIFEAAKRSGTMITAGWALDDGREVFAVPGSILSDKSEGTNRLLKQGAAPALSAPDILEALGLEGFVANSTELKPTEVPKLKGLGKALYDILSSGEAGLDKMVEQTSRTSAEILSELTLMEFDGVVESLAGQRYKLIK